MEQGFSKVYCVYNCWARPIDDPLCVANQAY